MTIHSRHPAVMHLISKPGPDVYANLYSCAKLLINCRFAVHHFAFSEALHLRSID